MRGGAAPGAAAAFLPDGSCSVAKDGLEPRRVGPARTRKCLAAVASTLGASFDPATLSAREGLSLSDLSAVCLALAAAGVVSPAGRGRLRLNEPSWGHTPDTLLEAAMEGAE